MTNIDNITDEQFYALIREECANIAEILVEKNKQYGNSILRSPNVFSKTTPLQKLHDRLDDKLSRVISGQEDDPEDAKFDIAGYLILERAVTRVLNGDLGEGREVVEKSATAEETKPAPKKRGRPRKKVEETPVEAPPAVEEITPVEEPAAPEGLESTEDLAAEEGLLDDLGLQLAELVEEPELTKTEESDLNAVDPEDLLGALSSADDELTPAGGLDDDGLLGLL